MGMSHTCLTCLGLERASRQLLPDDHDGDDDGGGDDDDSDDTQ